VDGEQHGVQDTELVEVVCPLNGTVVSLECGVGARVHRDSPVVTVESGPTRVAVEAGVYGVVDQVHAYVGGVVEPGSILAVVAADAASLDAADLTDPTQDAVLDEPYGAPASPPAVCTLCGAERLEPGFVEDRGQGASGFARWVRGPLEIGLFGARRMGRRRWAIEAYRCLSCSHLELFASEEV
jgi:Biotin-requiring enzyme